MSESADVAGGPNQAPQDSSTVMEGATGDIAVAPTPEPEDRAGSHTSGSSATQGALPLDVRTGDAGVDAAVSRLHGLDERPLGEHAEVFTTVHRELQDALVDLDRS